MADEYERSAEFIDVMIAPHWAVLGPPLEKALHGVTDPVVDVGAGGGHGTRMIAKACDGEIVAVEPSPGLRSVLLARVNEAADLRDRVTVLPEGLLDADLPPRLGAVVAMNVLGHFSPADRQRIWALLAERLVPGGRAVLNLQPPTEPATVPRTRSADVRLGRRRYEGWARAEPAGPDSVTWHMTYRIHHDDRLVGEVTATYDWWVLEERQLTAELARHHLKPAPTGPAELGMYLISRGDA